MNNEETTITCNELEISLEKGIIDKALYNITVTLLDNEECNASFDPSRIKDKNSVSISLIHSVADGVALLQGDTGVYYPRLLATLTEVNSIEELTDILTRVGNKLVTIRKRLERTGSKGQENKSSLPIGVVVNAIKATKALTELIANGGTEITLNLKDKKIKYIIPLKVKDHKRIIIDNVKNKKIAREIAKRLVWSASYKIALSLSLGGDKKWKKILF